MLALTLILVMASLYSRMEMSARNIQVHGAAYPFNETFFNRLLQCVTKMVLIIMDLE